MTRFTKALLLTVLLGAPLYACGEDKLTEIVLVVDSDLRVPSRMDSIRLLINGPTEMRSPISIGLTGADAAILPLTLGLRHAGGPLAPVSVVAEARLSGQTDPVVRRAVTTGFVRDERRVLRVLLLGECMGVACDSGQTCGEGGTCRSAEVAPESLPDYDGTIPGFDGGGADAETDAGTDGDVDPPEDGGAPPRVSSVGAGVHFTCAVLESGSVYCWGENGLGQLGNGSTAVRELTAQEVVGLGDARSVSVGLDHVCAVRSTNEIVCWGNNEFGQLGDGSGNNRVTPVRATDATQVSAGRAHTCAVDSARNVLCWGGNGLGQLGIGTARDESDPTLVPGLTSVAQVSSGGAHTCAVTTAGAVLCWGDNEYGKLGDGTEVERHDPTMVLGLPDPGTDPAVSVHAAAEHTCALLQSGSVMCWGHNDVGQLGDSTSTETKIAPSALNQGESGAATAVFTPAIGWHSCLIDASLRLWCWGANLGGQLGDGTNAQRRSPVRVSSLSDVAAAGMSNGHTCAVREGGELFCWGLNSDGQLGNGVTSTARHPLPIPVTAW